jgi:hypothetical protein
MVSRSGAMRAVVLSILVVSFFATSCGGEYLWSGPCGRHRINFPNRHRGFGFCLVGFWKSDGWAM